MVHASCVHVTFFDVCCYSDVFSTAGKGLCIAERSLRWSISVLRLRPSSERKGIRQCAREQRVERLGPQRPSTSNQSVVKTCPECTRSSPRRLPKFPNRLLLIESSVSRRLWAKSLRKVVVVPSIKGEFQNVYLTCFETGALSESKLAFGRACKTSCVLFRRTNDILRVHAKKKFQKISSQSKMTTKFCLQFFFSLTVLVSITTNWWWFLNQKEDDSLN